MPYFNIELSKTIVVAIEAETFKQARELALNDDDGFDGAWDRAEVTAEFEDTDD